MAPWAMFWLVFWVLVQIACGAVILAVPTIAVSRLLRRVIVAYKADAAVSSGPRLTVLLDAVFDALFGAVDSPEDPSALVHGEPITSHALDSGSHKLGNEQAVGGGSDSA